VSAGNTLPSGFISPGIFAPLLSILRSRFGFLLHTFTFSPRHVPANVTSAAAGKYEERNAGFHANEGTLHEIDDFAG
jgi:hypothetical protein